MTASDKLLTMQRVHLRGLAVAADGPLHLLFGIEL